MNSFGYWMIVIFGYIVLGLGTVGLLWGFLLSISKIRSKINKLKMSKNVYAKSAYWILNVLFWMSILVYFMAYYFFTVWFVLNSHAQIYNFPLNYDY